MITGNRSTLALLTFHHHYLAEPARRRTGGRRSGLCSPPPAPASVKRRAYDPAALTDRLADLTARPTSPPQPLPGTVITSWYVLCDDLFIVML